nr:guanine deaminase [Naematelia aurantialba]
MALFIGTFIDTPLPSCLRIRTAHLLAVSDEGYITHLAPVASEASRSLLSLSADVCASNLHLDPATASTATASTATTSTATTSTATATTAATSTATESTADASRATVTTLNRHAFVLPTYTDLHLHAPQYLYAGTGLDLPLMQWLDRYAYRAEERVDADPQLAKRVYGRLCERLVAAGTGCVSFFGSLSVDSNMILAECVQEAGLRGFIGKLSMDQSPRPTYGEASTDVSLSSVTAFLDRMSALVAPFPPHERLVEPILTPRFVPTCSDALLAGLAKISADRGVRVQSHMCESRDQIAWVENTRGKRDEDVWDEAGLLGDKTLQAHVTSLPPALISKLKDRGVTCAHCPLSNAYFSDAQFPLREALDADVKVGLGSDIAGGYALSIETAMRQAVVTARLREGARREIEVSGTAMAHADSQNQSLRVDWIESLYIATRGGKKAMGMGGCLEVGMEFDAQLSESTQPHIRIMSSVWMVKVDDWLSA